MLINIQLGQGADVDFEFALLRQRIGKLIVETVDSFNDKDILLSQLQVISLISVSYTHLDVYKRQGYLLYLNVVLISKS